MWTCQWPNSPNRKKRVLNGHSGPLLFFSGTAQLVDGFLWSLGARWHFTCVNLIHVPVWRLDGQVAAHLECPVWLLNSSAGRNPVAHQTPGSQPGHICKGDRQTGQTDQSGFAGLEISTGRREDCQDGRRDAGAWKHIQTKPGIKFKQKEKVKKDSSSHWYHALGISALYKHDWHFYRTKVSCNISISSSWGWIPASIAVCIFIGIWICE